MLFDLLVCANDAETGAGESLLSVHFDSFSRVGLNVALGVGESCLGFSDFSSLKTHFGGCAKSRNESLVGIAAVILTQAADSWPLETQSRIIRLEISVLRVS